MMRHCLIIALVAVGFSAAMSVDTYKTKNVDFDFTIKQKKIFDLLMFVDKVLVDTEYYEIGRDYDIMKNIDFYDDKEIVMDFMMHYNFGMLHKDGLFTYYNQEHRDEMMLLYRLFYCAKDFVTFYKTACWARFYLNHGMFTTAFTTAVMYRDDTRFIRLPAIYEIYPNMFFDTKVIREAYRMVMRHSLSGKFENLKNIEVYNDFTDVCLSPSFHHEKKLVYFMDDVNLNAYYYYFRMMMPFWMNTKEYNVPKNVRGDLYYFVHQQLMARYYLERISNGLGDIEEFTWDNLHLPGFHSNIMFGNGVYMPRRDWWNFIPMYKQRYVEYLKKLEIRIMEAIDSGFIIDGSGKKVDIMTVDGLNFLGNIIEGNYDSLNLKYYGSYDVLARDILGMDVDSMHKDYIVPSSLQYFGTSLKDPAFYRIYYKIVNFFLRYKSLLHRYTKEELVFKGIKIENMDVDKLVTFFDKKDYLINDIVDVSTFRDGLALNVKAWQYQLNYKPFTYKFAINSEKDTKAVMRIFMGPAFDGDKYDDYTYLLQYYKYFFMLDEFDFNLKMGLNNIERLSSESYFFKREYLNRDMVYRKIMESIHEKTELPMNDRMWGFPEHLMLPKGTVEGLKFKLFIYVGPYDDCKSLDLPFFGKRLWCGKSFGFPLDRPMQPWFWTLNNIYFKDVLVYHIENKDMMTCKNMNYMMKFGNMMMDYKMMSMKDYGKMDMKYMDSMKHVDDIRMKDVNRMGMDFDKFKTEFKDFDKFKTEFKDFDKSKTEFKDFDKFRTEFKDFDKFRPEFKDFDKFRTEFKDVDRMGRMYNYRDEDRMRMMRDDKTGMGRDSERMHVY